MPPLHPLIQAIADSRPGAPVGGFGPGPDDMFGEYKRAFLSKKPMTAGDATEFARIKHGHAFDILTQTCACGVTQFEYHMKPAWLAPLCEKRFPHTGGCSLQDWNNALDEMKRRGQDGFLSMMRVKSDEPATIGEYNPPRQLGRRDLFNEELESGQVEADKPKPKTTAAPKESKRRLLP